MKLSAFLDIFFFVSNLKYLFLIPKSLYRSLTFMRKRVVRQIIPSDLESA